jgi:hypothetical protein
MPEETCLQCGMSADLWVNGRPTSIPCDDKSLAHNELAKPLTRVQTLGRDGQSGPVGYCQSNG